MIEAAVTSGLAVLEGLKTIRDIVKERSEALDRSEVIELLGALREIYFFEDRTLAILNRIIAGDDLSGDQIDRTHGRFVRDQGTVEAALDRIERACAKPITP